MNQIIDICDKIIEMDKKRTQGEVLTFHDKLRYCANDLIMNCEHCKEEPFVLAHMNRNMDNWKNDLESLVVSVNHAAKLAMALKTSILELEKFSHYYPDAVYNCPDESIECLKEIEEIFK